MTYKIIDPTYSKELLEEYLNKKGYIFLGFIGDNMIFKYKEDSTVRRTQAKGETERFFELSESEFIDYIERLSIAMKLDSTALRIELEEFKTYRLEKGDKDKKCRWEKQDTFEVKARIKKRISNKKDKLPERIESKEEDKKAKSYYCEFGTSHKTEEIPYGTCDCHKIVGCNSARFIMNMKEIGIVMIGGLVNGETPLTKEQTKLYRETYLK